MFRHFHLAASGACVWQGLAVPVAAVTPRTSEFFTMEAFRDIRGYIGLEAGRPWAAVDSPCTSPADMVPSDIRQAA